jgi:hypothetical protein
MLTLLLLPEPAPMRGRKPSFTIHLSGAHRQELEHWQQGGVGGEVAGVHRAVERTGASVPVDDEVGGESHGQMPASSNGDLGDNAPGRMRFRTPYKAGLYLLSPARPKLASRRVYPAGTSPAARFGYAGISSTRNRDQHRFIRILSGNEPLYAPLRP